MEDNDFFGSPWAFGSRRPDKHWMKMQMMQARRGDMRGILLNALKERPMHGYEIIRYLEEASHGMWRPSPGSVYPTLQLLEEEDMVTSNEESGKKTYTITEKGLDAAKKTEMHAPWKHAGHDFKVKKELREIIAETIHALHAINAMNDSELTQKAMTILGEARDQLLATAHESHKHNKEV